MSSAKRFKSSDATRSSLRVSSQSLFPRGDRWESIPPLGRQRSVGAARLRLLTPVAPTQRGLTKVGIERRVSSVMSRLHFWALMAGISLGILIGLIGYQRFFAPPVLLALSALPLVVLLSLSLALRGTIRKILLRRR